ncbi:MAG TPA: class I SAM-dependent methyltransferase [Mariprofundaceae bacterium]|nr:class I SAM-dependent methyltransferase [Mariprofundaceae bacterium]
MARHKPIAKSRWLQSQKATVLKWHGKDVLAERLAHAETHYLPHLQKIIDQLPPKPTVLDIGSGPVCLSHFIDHANRVFIDPLLDDYQRAYPGALPSGKYLNCMAENIPLAAASCDLVMCYNALTYTLNPELVINEIERVLKPDGFLVVTIVTVPPLRARLRYLAERFVPALRDESQPYHYSHHGIRNTLSRHFDIAEEQLLQRTTGLSKPQAEWMFVCTHHH